MSNKAFLIELCLLSLYHVTYTDFAKSHCKEDIASHVSKLTGRRVKLTVLTQISDESKKIGIIDGVSLNISTHAGKKFTELMKEKN